ncbi:hypothetical protein ICN48_06420 [Polynucleobacter sp. JS-Safj-400b-B2]|uniref:hypothetical protein n=1 Tax=Polynucleobacter sp. JS-Safj-400b-B2 TaxID=2576921 RepID=UPI001C0D94CC|nr:hypothetical protein [Polynucleobacter sp. JS-Safj-400b-B2]MBU3625867.1 hypothetical protein [Polynucleobacter sp. JS-Safj-400b-B2]
MTLLQPWFHGTFTANIQQLRPLSHVGSRAAALHALARKHLRYEKIDPILHEVSIQLQPSEILQATDWYSPTPMGLLRHLIEKNVRPDLSGYFDALYDKIKKMKSSKLEWKLIGNIEVAKLLMDYGIKAISYENELEGGVKENSICIVDVNTAMLSSPIEISKHEWERAVKSLKA